MPPARDIDEQVRKHLSVLAYCIENSNQRNLQDINIYSEGVACGLLNILWGTNLIDLNREVSGNYPAIDLFDVENSIFLQVTSDDSLKKIRDTVVKSKKIEAENGLAITPKVLLLRFDKPKRAKTFKLNGDDQFTNAGVICLNDLAHEIQNQELNKKSEILEYIKVNIPIASDQAQYSLEVYLLKKLFESLASVNITDNGLCQVSESELGKKRQLYELFWTQIQVRYRSVLDQQRERSFKAAFDRLGEADRLRLTQYLGFESTKILDSTPGGNPNDVIDRLKEKIILDLSLPLISEIDVVHFLYYEFHNCNVLPIYDEVSYVN